MLSLAKSIKTHFEKEKGKVNILQGPIKNGFDFQRRKLKNELAEAETKLQQFRLTETIFESIPQFVLQLTIYLQKDPNLANIKSISFLDVMQISTSYLSTIVVLTSTLLNMPYFSIDDSSLKAKMETQFKSWKNWVLVVPIMMISATPRLALFVVNFTICRGIPALILNALLLITHYALCMKLMYSNEFMKGLQEQHILSMITSMFGPAMEVHPTRNILIVSSLAATCSHFFLALILTLMIYFSPLCLMKNDDILNAYRDNMVLFGFLLILPLTTLVLFLLKEEWRQIISLRLNVKPTCCEKEEQLIWAMGRKYNRLLKWYRKLERKDLSKYCKADYSLHDKKIILSNAFSHCTYGEKLCKAFTVDEPLQDNPFLIEVKKSMHEEGNLKNLFSFSFFLQVKIISLKTVIQACLSPAISNFLNLFLKFYVQCFKHVLFCHLFKQF